MPSPLIEQILGLADTEANQLPGQSREIARLSLFDWIVCGIGGLEEPVSTNVWDYVTNTYGAGVASVFDGSKASAAGAALANGTISHALDYDDTHFSHIGHLSVGVYPAALAVGQEVDASLGDLVDAYLVGAESAIRIGLALGAGHYQRGFHQTATAGAFGATVAAARLYGLSREQCRAALGLCAARASGLKSQFGTMGKPLNAGYAAANGVECATLASLGMTSADDGLEGSQGFIETHSDNVESAVDPGRFLFDLIRYKLHACCHGTHAMIEAILAAQEQNDFTPADVQSLQVAIHPKWLKVCDIKQPRTGLEVKFSYAWLAGMTMHGISTANPQTYADALCADAALQGFADKVVVNGVDGIADSAAEVRFDLADGSSASSQHDLMDHVESDVLAQRLRDKAKVVIGDQADELWAHVQTRDAVSCRALHSLF